MSKLILPRRKFLLGATAGVCAPAIVRAQSIIGSGVYGDGKTIVPPASFVGLGDLCVSLGITEPLHYWGTRAYKSAGIGSTKLLKVGTTDYTAVSGGMLDTGSSGGTVATWYDQVGTNNATANAGTTSVAFAPTGFGAGKPALSFATSSLILGTGLTQAKPYFIVAVAERTGNTGVFTSIIATDTAHNGGAPGLIFNNAANALDVYAGTRNDITCADNAFHAIGALFNGASSQAWLNGTGQGVVSAGTTDFDGGNVKIGTFTGDLLGFISEIAIFGYDASGSAAAISSNQRNATNGFNF